MSECELEFTEKDCTFSKVLAEYLAYCNSLNELRQLASYEIFDRDLCLQLNKEDFTLPKTTV